MARSSGSGLDLPTVSQVQMVYGTSVLKKADAGDLWDYLLAKPPSGAVARPDSWTAGVGSERRIGWVSLQSLTCGVSSTLGISWLAKSPEFWGARDSKNS